jgi:hypothetical protein
MVTVSIEVSTINCTKMSVDKVFRYIHIYILYENQKGHPKESVRCYGWCTVGDNWLGCNVMSNSSCTCQSNIL